MPAGRPQTVFVQSQFMDPAPPECKGLEGDEAGNANCNIVIDAARLEAGWEEYFGYLKDQGYAVLVGEFGGNMEWPQRLAPQRDQDRWSHITPCLQALSLKHGLSDFCDAELRPDLNNAIFVSD